VGVVWNRDCDFERQIEVLSYPQAGVVTGRSWPRLMQHFHS
jgi:hypothetical protein